MKTFSWNFSSKCSYIRCFKELANYHQPIFFPFIFQNNAELKQKKQKKALVDGWIDIHEINKMNSVLPSKNEVTIKS